MLEGLHIVTSKGRQYVYAWRGGPRLTAKMGSAEFIRQYHKAHEMKSAMPSSDTVAGIILEYQASRQFKNLAEATRKDHERNFPSILKTFGQAHLKIFDDARIKKDIRRWHESFDLDRQADKALGTLSRVLSFAQEDGQITSNAATHIQKRYERTLNPTPWTETELMKYLEGVPAYVERIALLASLTGLARADLARLSWSHISDNKITIRRKKTNQTARIFIDEELGEFLNETPKDRLNILVNSRGLPWTSDGLGKTFDKHRHRLGIDKTLHDLRATYATRLYRRGGTDEDASDSLGWSIQTVRHIRKHYVDDEAIFTGRIHRLGRTKKEQ